MFEAAVGSGPASAKLANALQHATQLRVTVLLSLVTIVCALALSISLFVITRDYDGNVALFGLAARLAEAVTGGVYAIQTAGLLSVATVVDTSGTGAQGSAVVAHLLSARSSAAIMSAVLFAIGSAAFSYLLLRGRGIPTALEWLGLLASALLLLALPIQLLLDARGPVTMLVWLPMLMFEVVVAVWLLVRGVSPVFPGVQVSRLSEARG